MQFLPTARPSTTSPSLPAAPTSCPCPATALFAFPPFQRFRRVS
jgi:hypothetical protein